jgi:AsmA protein
LNLTGKLSLAGDFSGQRIDADDFRRSWQGQAHLQMSDTRTEGLNFQQLVQQAVARSTNVQAQENYDNATRLDSMSSDLLLDSGEVTLKYAGAVRADGANRAGRPESAERRLRHAL